MDTSEQVAIETSSHTKRRRRTVEEKRRIVEETLEAGASVARVARRHAVNANQVFYWRKKYREGRLGKGRSSNLLPVAVSEIPSNKSGQVRCVSSRCSLGAMGKRPDSAVLTADRLDQAAWSECAAASAATFQGSSSSMRLIG